MNYCFRVRVKLTARVGVRVRERINNRTRSEPGLGIKVWFRNCGSGVRETRSRPMLTAPQP